MSQGQWMMQNDYRTMERYDIDNLRPQLDDQSSPAYDQQHGHYGLLGPPNAVVPHQLANVDINDIPRYVRTTSDAPYAAGQRSQPSQGPHAYSFPGAPGIWAGSYQDNHPPGPSGHSSTTASDSAYQSLIVTSGPSVPPYGSQAVDGAFNVFGNPTPEHVNFGYTGTESLLSEPAEQGVPRQQPQRRARARSKSTLAPCHVCGKQLKNPSDAQKHELQHVKPFKCHEGGCNRNGEGFATQNDLQRHRSSVHKKTPLVGRRNGFICIMCIPAQGAAPKYWPRRDNFKAHVKRKHPEADPNVVIERSQRERPDDAMTAVESGYGSGSHIDDLDQAMYRQELTSPLVTGMAGQFPQQGDYLFDHEATSHGDALVGVGGGAGPLADSGGPSREPDLGIYAADSRYGLSVLSTAAVAMNDMSPMQGLHMMVPGEPWTGVPRVVVSNHEIEQYAIHEAAQWGIQDNDRPPRANSEAGAKCSSVTEDQGTFRCQDCGKRRKRECDLRKHMKRHTRPYGCTFPLCYKRFGSRNDWKRHENSQHFLQEMWRCNVATDSGKKCGHVEHDGRFFAAHLRQKHQGIFSNEHEIDQHCELWHLRANAHNCYWCGYCNDLIRQDGMETQNAMEARYKHIGDHYDKDDDTNVDDWVCTEKNVRKAELSSTGRKRASMHSSSRRMNDDDDSDLDGLMLPPDQMGYAASTTRPPISSISGVGLSSISYARGNKRRRTSPDLDQDAENVSDA